MARAVPLDIYPLLSFSPNLVVFPLFIQLSIGMSYPRDGLFLPVPAFFWTGKLDYSRVEEGGKHPPQTAVSHPPSL